MLALALAAALLLPSECEHCIGWGSLSPHFVNQHGQPCDLFGGLCFVSPFRAYKGTRYVFLYNVDPANSHWPGAPFLGGWLDLQAPVYRSSGQRPVNELSEPFSPGVTELNMCYSSQEQMKLDWYGFIFGDLPGRRPRPELSEGGHEVAMQVLIVDGHGRRYLTSGISFVSSNCYLTSRDDCDW